jgi:NADPH-dependent 2,4-dienoyl-CoA reductase/sulfur reductase-like enzyme
LAAAIEARKQGIESVLVLERDIEAGGILRQCIHDGFGLHRFGKRMSGGQYAQVFLDELESQAIQVFLNTMVLDITLHKEIFAASEQQGMMKIQAKAIVLAMGCRERTRSQAFIYGTRPSGVLTAGAVQRYINIEGFLPGRRAVILGSGDIGLIMARRMTLEGMDVEGVYEIMPSLGGLRRNVVQCLNEYNIPLHLSTTVTWIHGRERLEGVTVAEVDESRTPIPGTERHIDCDLLVLAVGLIPENELSIQAGVQLHPVTKGPLLDESLMTSVDGIFAAGNVAAVFDLVDYVSQTGELAARGAARYIRGSLDTASAYTQITPGANVSFVLPQRVRYANVDEKLPIYLRVGKPMTDVVLTCEEDGREIYRKKHGIVVPPEMLCGDLVISTPQNADRADELVVSVQEVAR